MTQQYCAVVPTYNNPMTIARVAHALLEHLPHVFIVDDGSRAEGREAVRALEDDPRITCHYRSQNGGKGAAVKDGLRLAAEAGFSHALQADADFQHDLTRTPAFIEASRERPDALILAYPLFDESVPKSRLFARQITIFWTTLETYGRSIVDPMCGLRVYPLAASLRALPASNYMDFDPEIAVRLVWGGAPVINLPVQVRYLSAEEGGVSHFHLLSDNLRISWMHTRLFTLALLLLPFNLLRRRQQRASNS